MIKTVRMRIKKLPFTGNGQSGVETNSSDRLKKIAALDKASCFEMLNSSEQGLDTEAAEERQK